MTFKFLILSLALTYAHPVEEVKILTPEIQMGKIKINEKVQYRMLLKNTSAKPLRILNVIGDCGCLSFQWSKKPIRSNAIDTIIGTVILRDTSDFRKSILVYTDSKTGFHTLEIIGKGVLK